MMIAGHNLDPQRSLLRDGGKKLDMGTMVEALRNGSRIRR